MSLYNDLKTVLEKHEVSRSQRVDVGDLVLYIIECLHAIRMVTGVPVIESPSRSAPKQASAELAALSSLMSPVTASLPPPRIFEPDEKRDIATKLVAAFENDISDRRGLKQEWNQIDADVKDSVRRDWTEMIEEILP